MNQSANISWDYYAVIRQPESHRILLIDTGAGCHSLPHWVDTPIRWQAAHHVIRMVRDHLGLHVHVLRPLRITRHPSHNRLSLVYELEPVGALDDLPSHMQWVDKQGLEQVTFAVPEHHADVEVILNDYEQNCMPMHRPPWANPGWFVEVVDWIHTQLRQQHLTLVGPLEQIHTRQRGFVARGVTDQGDIYFKACPAFFPQEVPLAVSLAAHDPRHFPTILSYDAHRRWLLMRAFVGKLLDTVTELASWEQVLRVYAGIQIHWATRVEHLLALGCPDRRLHVLQSQIGLLCDNPEALQVGQAPFSEAECEALRAMGPLLQRACAKLGSYNIPPSLEHGDFAPFNVAITDDNCLFFDWSEASVTHPFLGSCAFANSIEGYGADLSEIRETYTPRLEAAYLEAWQPFEPQPRLTAAFKLSQPLSAVHYALSSKLFVLPNVEARWEEENMCVSYARKLLTYQEELASMVGDFSGVLWKQ